MRVYFKHPAFSFLATTALALTLTAAAASTASARSHVHLFDPTFELPDESGTSTPQALLEGPAAWVLDQLFVRPGDAAAAKVRTAWFDQKLDPSDDGDERTFKQRYYVYSAHAQGPDSPVVYSICGESECTSRSFLGRFTEDVAKALGAHVIALEHRYYGRSVPFDQLTPDNLKYLSTENALADLERFQTHMMLHEGLRGSWVAIGGSYPGSLAAYYRLTRPDLVVGALASSAPVQAKNNFEEYDAHVTQVLGEECSEALRLVVAASEDALNAGDGGAAFDAFKARFDASEVREERDVLYVLADVTAYAVQYGAPGKLCTRLLGAARGAQDRAKDAVVEAYAEHVKEFLKSMGLTAVKFSPEGSQALGAQASGGMRQWYYQSCTEYGYWQDAHSDPKRSTRSPRINPDYDRDFCRRLFGIERLADESAINDRYYARLLSPAATRIVYTNGSTDPWLKLSINAVRGNDTNPATPSVMIEGKAHCDDLRAQKESDPQSLKDARKLFLDLAKGWVL